MYVSLPVRCVRDPLRSLSGMKVTVAPSAALTALDGIVVAGGDAATCQRWLGEIRRVRGFLDSVEARVLLQVDALARVGESFGSRDTSTGCSGVSSNDAGKLTDRAQTSTKPTGSTTHWPPVWVLAAAT